MWLFLILSLPCISISAMEASLVPFITKCKLDDNKCAEESARKAIPIVAEGLPNLNVRPSDPLKIKEVNASKPGLEIIVTDIVVTGLKNCELRKFGRDTVKEHITLTLRCTVVGTGDYTMKGQLLLMTLSGDGLLFANINEIDITVDVDYNTVEVKDEKYWKLSTWKYDYELVGESSIRFDNLFPSSEILRKATEDVIAQNGNAVIKEMGTPLITAVVKSVVKNIRDFLINVPLKYLVLS